MSILVGMAKTSNGCSINGFGLVSVLFLTGQSNIVIIFVQTITFCSFMYAIRSCSGEYAIFSDLAGYGHLGNIMKPHP